MTLEELTTRLHTDIPQFDSSRHELEFQVTHLEVPVLNENGLKIDTTNYEASLCVDGFEKDGFAAKVIVVLRES